MKAGRQASNQGDIPTPRVLHIELLALDLNSCTRCVGTLDNIEKAIDMVRPTLELMEVQVTVDRIVVESEDQARRYRFATSPTVRINGQDIAFQTIENECDSCTDLCGCDEGTSCRVWSYRGKEYTEAPVGLVVDSILRAIFSNQRESADGAPEYGGVPENLQRFFEGKSPTQADAPPCCPPPEQETCCTPTQKASCCDASAPETCGCR